MSPDKEAALDDAKASFQARTAQLFRQAGVTSCCPACHREKFITDYDYIDVRRWTSAVRRICGHCGHYQNFLCDLSCAEIKKIRHEVDRLDKIYRRIRNA